MTVREKIARLASALKSFSPACVSVTSGEMRNLTTWLKTADAARLSVRRRTNRRESSRSRAQKGDLASSTAYQFITGPQAFERIRKIGVGESNHAAGRAEHTGADGRPFSSILRQGKCGEAVAETARDRGRFIATAVIGDHDAIVDSPAIEIFAQLLQSCAASGSARCRRGSPA